MIELYTDGACSPNPGTGGWAACFKWNDKVHEIYGYEENTTNNKMELNAVIEGIQLIRATAPNEKDITIYSDSQWVIKCATKEWQRKANLNLWDTLVLITAGYNISWVWIEGHIGNELNERCDALAVKARESKITNKKFINGYPPQADYEVMYNWVSQKDDMRVENSYLSDNSTDDDALDRVDKAASEFLDNLHLITYKENFDRVILFLTTLGYLAKGALLENDFDKCKDVLSKLIDYIDKNVIGKL